MAKIKNISVSAEDYCDYDKLLEEVRAETYNSKLSMPALVDMAMKFFKDNRKKVQEDES